MCLKRRFFTNLEMLFVAPLGSGKVNEFVKSLSFPYAICNSFFLFEHLANLIISDAFLLCPFLWFTQMGVKLWLLG